MFRRKDNLIVTQSEHSRISGELTLLFGRFLDLDVRKLAGAVAVHDWPHFGGAQADVIEIGKKTEAQQRELVERLAGELPVDPFTELVMRMHWQRLSEESDVEMRAAANQSRIDSLKSELGLEQSQANRLDRWTDICDALAFYLSQGLDSSGKDVLPDIEGERSWSFHWTVASEVLSIHQVRVGPANAVVHRDEAMDTQPFETRLSLLSYESDGYPQELSPTFRVILCRFGA